MATPGHVYRDTWYSGQRCWCCDLTDADIAADIAAVEARLARYLADARAAGLHA